MGPAIIRKFYNHRMNEKPILYVQKGHEDEIGINSYDDEIDEKVSLTIQDMNRKDNRCHVSPTTHMINGKEETPSSIHNNNNNNTMSPMQITTITSKRGRKTDREREEAGGRREWSDAEISKLMQLWRENDILYDTNHPLYYVQSERKLVMDQISSEMEIGVRDVNDKMHSLRTYYCSQRQRTESLEARNGNGRALPRWKFYDQMSFLYESVTNRAAKSSLNATKRGRKPQNRSEQQSSIIDQQQSSPYSMTMASRPESYSPSSHDNDIRQHYQERALSYTDERYDMHNGTHRTRRNTPIIYQQSTSPASSTDENPRKRHLSDQGYPWSDMLPYTKDSPVSKDSTTCKTIEIQLNTADEVFGHMVACSMAQLGDEQEKELLKLEIQKLIYNTRFKSNGNR